MELSTPEAPRSDIDIMRQCTDQLRQRLPTEWRVSAQPQTGTADNEFDGIMTISPDDAPAATFLVDVKRLVTRTNARSIAAGLRNVASRSAVESRAIVMARYLSPSAREALDEYKLSYVDATGNVRLSSSQPALFVRDRGADKDPWRGPGRPRGTLAGDPAARIVRTLARRSGPWSARELVKVSGASTGATYRVLEYLQEEGLVDKQDTDFTLTDWSRLLRLWSRDYGFLQTNRTLSYIEPRGVEAFLAKLRNTPADLRYAVTGSAAAGQWASYAPTRSIFLYVDQEIDPSEVWGLKQTEAGVNVIVAQPRFDVVFANTSVGDAGYNIVAPEQAAVDLLSGPGRNPSEGEELLEWMQLNEPEWRRG
jgi:hypothetical protein